MKADAMTLYDLTPGTLVGGRYRVVGPHRQGGLSTAFEVTDEEGGERCEMQLFPHGLFERPEQAEEFRQSLEPWTEVRADAVLPVLDVLALGPSALLLVTAYPEGESLRERLNREKRLGHDEVVAIGIRLLEGLATLHARRLVHGDIKPYTIHVSGSGADTRAVLVDGGFTSGLWTAKDLGEKTALIGTPYYAPVEQFGGDSPDVNSDLYNVATVLFECVAGVLPWAGKSFLEIFQAKLDRTRPSISKRAPDVEVDPGLEDAIVAGCCAERKLRFPSADAFRAALEALRAP